MPQISEEFSQQLLKSYQLITFILLLLYILPLFIRPSLWCCVEMWTYKVSLKILLFLKILHNYGKLISPGNSLFTHA